MRARFKRYLAALSAATMVAALAVSTSIAVWAATKGPDGGGYTGTDAAVYSFIDVSGSSGGVSVLAGTDDGVAALTLPFSFRFYGQVYPSVCVSSNGALYFVAAASACTGLTDFANSDLSTAATPGDLPALLPYWSDLTFDVPGGGAVFYQTLGTPGSRRFIVQWSNAYPQGSANPVTFQTILSEGTDNIQFQYKNVNLGPGNPASNGAQATVGIRTTGAPANQKQLAWSFNAPVVAENSVLSFSTATAVTCAANVSSSFGVTRSGYVYNPVTQRFSQTVKLINTSASPISGPLALVIDGLSANATLFSPSGSTSCATPAGRPYVSNTTATLAPGATVSIVLQFTNPTKASIAYNTRVLAGTGPR